MTIGRPGRSSIAVCLAAVLLAVIAAPEAGRVDAAFPGKNGQIAFIKSNLSTGSCPKGSIWTMDADGGGQRELTGGIDLGVIGGVAWSPDGRRLAFTVQTDLHEPLDVMGVLVMDADGGNKSGLVNIPVGAGWRCDPGGPTWSPDGTKLAVGGADGIYVIDLADPLNPANITAGAPDFYDQPAWSPDGASIAVRVPARGAIGEVPAAGGAATLLTEAMAASRPNWSPDGKRIVFETGVGAEIGILDRCYNTVSTINRGGWGEHHPAWSPDGESIAFEIDVDDSVRYIDVPVPPGAGPEFTGRLAIGAGFRSDILTSSPDLRRDASVNLTKTGGLIREAMPDWQPTGRPPKFPGCSIAFDYSVPARFGLDRSGDGLIDYATSPEDVQHDRYPVKLTVSAGDRRCDSRKRYAWSADGSPLEAVQRAGDKCVFDVDFPAEGNYDVVLKVNGQNASHREVMVQDWLIVSLGDSVASGEGNPDLPGPNARWQDYRCDRSAFARGAQAALRLEQDDPKTSVTFVHLACSGATMLEGLLGSYDGINPSGYSSPVPPQMNQLVELVGDREIDAVDLSIGANDIGFGPASMFCAFNAECLGQPYDDVHLGAAREPTSPVGAPILSAVIRARVATLPALYDSLDVILESLVPSDRVYITEYPDLTKDTGGAYCDDILWLDREVDDWLTALKVELYTGSNARIAEAEAEGLDLNLLIPLNKAVAAAASKGGWNTVDGVASGFRTHGYCANDRWVRQLRESLAMQGNMNGPLHPNEAGHVFTGQLLLAKMLEDLYDADGSPRAPEPGKP